MWLRKWQERVIGRRRTWNEETSTVKQVSGQPVEEREEENAAKLANLSERINYKLPGERQEVKIGSAPRTLASEFMKNILSIEIVALKRFLGRSFFVSILPLLQKRASKT